MACSRDLETAHGQISMLEARLLEAVSGLLQWTLNSVMAGVATHWTGSQGSVVLWSCSTGYRFTRSQRCAPNWQSSLRITTHKLPSVYETHDRCDTQVDSIRPFATGSISPCACNRWQLWCTLCCLWVLTSLFLQALAVMKSTNPRFSAIVTGTK